MDNERLQVPWNPFEGKFRYAAVTDRRPALYPGVPANDLAWHPDPSRRSDREDPENPLAFVVAVI